jgi:hypothetical protein
VTRLFALAYIQTVAFRQVKSTPKKLLPPENRQTRNQKTLWTTLQADFEKVVKRKDDLKEVLAAVVGDNSDFTAFHETLLKMEGFRPNEVRLRLLYSVQFKGIYFCLTVCHSIGCNFPCAASRKKICPANNG